MYLKKCKFLFSDMFLCINIVFIVILGVSLFHNLIRTEFAGGHPATEALIQEVCKSVLAFSDKLMDTWRASDFRMNILSASSIIEIRIRLPFC